MDFFYLLQLLGFAALCLGLVKLSDSLMEKPE